MAVIKLSESKVKFIKDVCKSFGNKGSEVINVLHKVQGEFGYLSAEVQELIADELHIPPSKVYGIVSFYTFFTMTPKGRHPIQVCLGTACYVRGAEKVLDEIKRQLGIQVGSTTKDNKFSLNCLRCVGACGLAPVVIIDDRVYGHMTPDKVGGLLSKYND